MSGEKLLQVLLVCVVFAPFFTRTFFGKLIQPFYEPESPVELDHLRRKAYWTVVIATWAGLLTKNLFVGVVAGVVVLAFVIIPGAGKK